MPFFPGAPPFVEVSYAAQLRILNESPLSEDSALAGVIIRFLWSRTWHDPVVFRVEPSPDGLWELQTKIGSGVGAPEPGQLIQDMTRSVSPAQIEVLHNALAAGQFWALPSHVKSNGRDGAAWILEVRDGSRYHYLDRWCPQDGLVYELGRHLMTLSGSDFGPIY